MRDAKLTIFIFVLLYAGFMVVGSAKATPQRPVDKRPGTWELIRKSRQKQPEQKTAANSKPSELLDKYAATQDLLMKSFRIEYEETSESVGRYSAGPRSGVPLYTQKRYMYGLCRLLAFRRIERAAGVLRILSAGEIHLDCYCRTERQALK